MDFKNTLKDKTKIIDDNLKKYLEHEEGSKLFEAMSYSVFAGGKRLRPLIMLSVFENFSKKI